jgi:hypothetical protein
MTSLSDLAPHRPGMTKNPLDLLRKQVGFKNPSPTCVALPPIEVK